jgi:hypothetical protein
MSNSLEPPNGDFVAYLEELERQSAARVLSKSQVAFADLSQVQGRRDIAAHLPVEQRKPEGRNPSVPVLDRQQAEELVARLARGRPVARATPIAVSLAIGIVLLLYWFIARGGAVPFLIGLALTIWSLSRLRGLGRGLVKPVRGERDQVAQVFGTKPPQT